MTCYRWLRVLDKAAHRSSLCANMHKCVLKSCTREVTRLCGQQGKKREVERESMSECTRRDGDERPARARGSEVLSKMLCSPASGAT